MPQLPTFTVDDGTAQRILATFAGQHTPDGNPVPPEEAYKGWLRDRLVDWVTSEEAERGQATLRAEIMD